MPKIEDRADYQHALGIAEILMDTSYSSLICAEPILVNNKVALEIAFDIHDPEFIKDIQDVTGLKMVLAVLYLELICFLTPYPPKIE